MNEKDSLMNKFVIVFKRQKRIIIGLTLLSLIVSFILNYFFFKPVFLGSATVFLAQVNNNLLIKAKDVQTQVTSDAFIQKTADDLGIKSEQIKDSLSVNTAQDSKLLVVSFESNDKELIVRFFDYFITELNNFNREAFEYQINALKSQQLVLTTEINSLQKQAEEVLVTLNNLQKKSTTNAEYVLEYSQLRAVYDSILNKRMTLITQIAQIDSTIKSANMFFYQSKPLIVDTPVKPRKVFNIAVSGIIAFLLSIFLGLFLESLNVTRRVN